MGGGGGWRERERERERDGGGGGGVGAGGRGEMEYCQLTGNRPFLIIILTIITIIKNKINK